MPWWPMTAATLATVQAAKLKGDFGALPIDIPRDLCGNLMSFSSQT